MPNALRHQVTSIVSVRGNPGSQQEIVSALELVPFREELFRAEELDTPQKIARALHLIQRHISEATKASRSLPVLGGSYWPNVALPANTTIAVPHGLGATVALLPVDVRVKAGAAPAQVTDAGQSSDGNIVYVRTTTACTVDLWVFPKPAAVGRGTAVPTFGAPAQTTTPSGLILVSQLAPGLDGQFLVTGVASLTTPDQIAGLQMWLRSDTVVLSSGKVSQWTDKSGNGNHATQGTGAQQPVYLASDRTYDYQASLQFSGAQYMSTSLVVAQPLTIYLVGSIQANGTSAEYIFASTAGGGTIGFYQNTDGNFHYQDAPMDLTGTVADDTIPHIFCGSFASGVDNFYRDNSDATDQSGSGGGNTLSSPYVGTVNGSLSSTITGSLVEVIVYSGTHTQAQRRLVMGYLAARYGLAVVGPPLTAEWVYPAGDVSPSTTAPGVLVVTGLQKVPVSATPPLIGGSLLYDGSQYGTKIFQRDVAVATSGNVTVEGLQNVPLAPAVPTVGQELIAQAFDPTAIGGNGIALLAWYRADKGITQSGGTVSQWNDSSGNGDANRNASNGTGATQPTYQASNASYNNQPTLTFSPSGAFLQSGTWTTARNQPITVFAVCHTTATGNRYLFDCLPADAAHQAMYGKGSASLTLNGGTELTGAPAITSPSVVYGIFNGANSAVAVGNVTPQVTGPGGSFGATGLVIGNYYGEGAGNEFGGTIAEVIVYAGALNAAEIALVMGYLANRYALTVTGSVVPTVAWAPKTPPVVSALRAYFGDGSDGTGTFDGTATPAGVTKNSSTSYTANRDLYYTTATISSGVTLNMNGWRLFCRDQLGGAGIVACNGNNAANNIGGVQSTYRSLNGGLSGANAPTSGATAGNPGNSSSGNPPGFGGAGGAGGASTGAGGGAGGTNPAPNNGPPRASPEAILGMYHATANDPSGILLTPFFGGAGGGSGGHGSADGANAAGGGGGGAGVLLVSARIITGTVALNAIGGAGGSATSASGAGGGGGGGVVTLVYEDQSTWSGTASVAGGAAGTGGHANGTAGGAGLVIQIPG